MTAVLSTACCTLLFVTVISSLFFFSSFSISSNLFSILSTLLLIRLTDCHVFLWTFSHLEQRKNEYPIDSFIDSVDWYPSSDIPAIQSLWCHSSQMLHLRAAHPDVVLLQLPHGNFGEAPLAPLAFLLLAAEDIAQIDARVACTPQFHTKAAHLLHVRVAHHRCTPVAHHSLYSTLVTVIFERPQDGTQ